MRCFVQIMLMTTLLAGSMSTVVATAAPPSSVRSEDSVKTFALQWFAEMEAGQIDRTQLTSSYSAQLTNDAVLGMSRELKMYGASPTGAQVLRSRAIDGQTFYLVKLLFPRGDSAAMLLGFNTEARSPASIR